MTLKPTPRSLPLALLCSVIATASHAAVTDLATTPLSAADPKPNIMFVLDDSGSMAWTHMPDPVENFDIDAFGNARYGYASSQCNGVYYNPATVYRPPVDATGTAYPNASFTAAWNDGYDTGDGTRNLSNNFVPYTGPTPNVSTNWTANTPAGTAAYYFTYSGTQNTEKLRDYFDTNSLFYRECASNVGAAPGNGVFTRVTVAAAEQQNFANWYSYYRTRMLTMKTVTGRAFRLLDDSYRVGFSSINNNNAPAFANITDFTTAQKTTWYSKLYTANAYDGTPLRRTLSQVGQIYAGTRNTMNGAAVTDPVQYSCQRNFTILSTDGYWSQYAQNNAGQAVDERGYQVNNSTLIGNVDDTDTRPYNGPTASTLADVAAYYYKTDLRTAGGMATDNVRSSPNDPATWQHMTTFTLGLGARGRMTFYPDYRTATSGDFADVKNGVTASATTCNWQAAGSACNWPIPGVTAVATTTAAGSGLPENIDDLWHAAVNGHGTHYSASDPNTLTTGLYSAFQAINAIASSSAATAISNPVLAAGDDNARYASTFLPGYWSGTIARSLIDPISGVTSATPDWTVTTLGLHSARTIYMSDSGSGARKSFDWASMNATERAYFSRAYVSTTAQPTLSQFCTDDETCLTTANQDAASGEGLVNFLRGDRSQEGIVSSSFYRLRADAVSGMATAPAVLGDIVNSRAVFVGKVTREYVDAGYATFRANNASRQKMIYVGANDGMLHAINADTGVEAWAYVPSAVLPTLYRLADKFYDSKHNFYVDGSPTVGDALVGGVWRTILIGGLNRGGRGYYALDITVPTSPTVLWEVSNNTAGFTDLGYSYAKPVITKLKDGTWVAMVSSGYNNTGGGYLYVINAGTGALIRTIGTGVGSAATPSGLGQISNWVDNTRYDNTTQRVYGGDMLGNLWRFDVNGDVGAAGYDAQLLATLRNAAGNAQPITTKPELGLVKGVAVVYVGTGRYLGLTDLADTGQQSLYAIKDALTTASVGNPRANATVVRQTMTATTCAATSGICVAGAAVRQGSSNAVDFAVNNGWYVDLPAAYERANTDPALQLGILALTTNALDATPCTGGGSSYVNFFDYRTGAPVTSANGYVSVALGNVLASAITVTQSAKDPTKLWGQISTSDGKTRTVNLPVPTERAPMHRSSWRELPTGQ